jgi:hypothetical protein
MMQRPVRATGRGRGVTRRLTGNMNGERYLGDSEKMMVHDQDKEKAACLLDAIITAGHDVPFDTLEEAHDGGYANCHSCL